MNCDEDYYINIMLRYTELGVYSVAGPNWEHDYQVLCDAFGKKECIKMKFYNTTEPTCVQNLNHLGANYQQDRFQYYAPDYAKGDKIKPLIPLENIDRIPMTFFVLGEDIMCTVDHALQHVERMTKKPEIRFIPGAKHQYFGEPIPDSTLDMLISELQ